MNPLSVRTDGESVVLTVELSKEQAEAARMLLELAPYGWLRLLGAAISSALETGQEHSGEHRIAAR
jgi:hypothetical protein